MPFHSRQFAARPRAILLCPGPVLLSPAVLRAVLETHIGHREPEFSQLLTESVAMVKPIVGIRPDSQAYEVAFITGSGTAANETVLASIGAQGPVQVITNGEFGERLLEVVRLHNHDVDQLDFGWQQVIDLEKVAASLSKKPYHLVAMVHHETSSGILNPIAAVARLAHQRGALISVDAVSSIGAEVIDAERAGIDVVVGASGKALSAMPGVGILIVKRAVLATLATHATHSHYLDLRKHFTFMRDQAQTPNTPAVHVFVSLHAALKEITALGVGEARQVITDRALLTRHELTNLGLTYANYGAQTSNVITCVTLPVTMPFGQLARELKQHGIVIYNGKGVLKDRIFQIGHIGALRPSDTPFALAKLKEILRQTAQRSPQLPRLAMASR